MWPICNDFFFSNAGGELEPGTGSQEIHSQIVQLTLTDRSGQMQEKEGLVKIGVTGNKWIMEKGENYEGDRVQGYAGYQCTLD